jgi:hypothetical protein
MIKIKDGEVIHYIKREALISISYYGGGDVALGISGISSNIVISLEAYNSLGLGYAIG